MSNISSSSVNELKVLLKEKKLQKILLICGENSFEVSGASKVLKDLLKNKELKIFKKKFSYPELNELNQIIESIKDFSPDLILAVGGGSVIDYAKTANVLTDSKNLKNEILNSNYEIKKKFTKLAVIAGSGAEVTSNAVIYIDKIKYSVEGNFLKPDFFFLIPELVITGSNKIKSSAGFDAIAQALESLVSRKSNDKSVEYASKSLRVSVNSFISFINEPNMKNATEMSIASNLAGKAISISKTTAPHAASYPFTSLFNISHGHAVSLFFEKFFKFNYENIDKSETSFDLKKRFDLIFNLFDVQDINGFNSKISLIKKSANLEDDLTKFNIDIIKSSEDVLKGINLLRLGNNPVKIDGKDILNIITKN